MRPGPSFPLPLKANSHLYGLGIQVSKMEPLLPRIHSNGQLKYKNCKDSPRMVAKKLFKLGPSHFPTQPSSSQKRPYKAIQISEQTRFCKKQILAQLRKCRQKTIEDSIEGSRDYGIFLYSPSTQLPNRSHRLQKLSLIQQRSNKKEADKPFQEFKKEYLLASRKLTQLQPQTIEGEDRKSLEKTQTVDPVKQRRRPRKILLDRIEDAAVRARKQIEAGTIDGYEVQKQPGEIELCEYMKKKPQMLQQVRVPFYHGCLDQLTPKLQRG